MKRLLAIASIAAVAAVSSLPAAAQTYYDGPNQNWRQRQSNNWDNGWRSGWDNGRHNGWNSRYVSGSDPSFGNRQGLNAARRTGRCVEDLGYGRFEYCGW